MTLGAFVEDGTQRIVDLFVPFADLTTGNETYSAGRYLDLQPTPTGLYNIDFNRAYNPYCAYNETYECPFPPPSNRLKIDGAGGREGAEGRMTQALQAIVFDFDGVIANSEPLHLQAFQQTLAENGIDLSAADYYRALSRLRRRRGVLRRLARDRGLALDEARVAALVARKGVAAAGADARRLGALSRARRRSSEQAAAAVPIAIASGALRHEIDEIVDAAGLAGLFPTIVASGDTPESKPSPAPYRLAFDNLRRLTGRDLDPRRSVAIEDSRWGLESARGAGLRCVGVTNSYPAEELTGAEIVVSGLGALTVETLEGLVQEDALLPRS